MDLVKIKNFSRKIALIIAEIGINHNGNLNLVKRWLCGKSGADAIKLQSINQIAVIWKIHLHIKSSKIKILHFSN